MSHRRRDRPRAGPRPALAAVACLGLLLVAPAPRPPETPATMLWAWERPEDLRFLDPATTGVAFLAATATLRGGEVDVRPRMQPLWLPDGAHVEAVVRVEVARDGTPSLSGRQRTRLAAAIVDAAGAPDVRAVQIDFDAAASQRGFYMALLDDVRAALPDGTGLSITALASWCLGDPWIAELPVDAAVPMLFEMGPDGPSVRRHLAGGGDLAVPLCRRAVGLSTAEPWPPLPPERRRYLFHETSWTAAVLEEGPP